MISHFMERLGLLGWGLTGDLAQKTRLPCKKWRSIYWRDVPPSSWRDVPPRLARCLERETSSSLEGCPSKLGGTHGKPLLSLQTSLQEYIIIRNRSFKGKVGA